MDRRKALTVLAATLMTAGAVPAQAQPFASRPIRLLVGYPPGAQTDAIARLLVKWLGDSLGAAVVVENRSGASGTVAAAAAAQAVADGHTLLLAGNSDMVLAPLVFEKLAYAPTRDFLPIGAIARVSSLIAVGQHVPARSMHALLELARKSPRSLTFGAGALGYQVVVELLSERTGVEFVTVPYKGTAPALADLIAGRIDVMLADQTALLPHMSTGAVIPLASTRPGTAAEPSGIPTLADAGVQGLSYYAWKIVMVPGKTPVSTVNILRKEVARVTHATGFQDELRSMGLEPFNDSPEELLAHIVAETERSRPIVKRLGITESAL